jgi:choline dehydrogenase-like flavoprotein
MLVKNAHELDGRASADRRVVVIGSGAVGMYAATELARRGRDVVLLEAGGLALGRFDPSSYRCVGRAHEGVASGRGRTLGGTTNLWGGQLSEFDAIDLGPRAAQPDGWPIAFSELARFYPTTYESLGIPEAVQRDDDVWRSIRTTPPHLGSGLEVFLTRWLPIPSFALWAREELEQRTNLRVLTGHTAVGFDGADTRIHSVTVVDRTGAEHAVAGSTFVLAAGTIETARLLLHTADSDAWRVPWRGNRWLGARFQDHLGGRIADVHPTDSSRFFKTFSNLLIARRKYQPKFQLDAGARAKGDALNVHGMFAFESSISENLVYLKQFVKAALYGRQIGGLRSLAANVRASARYLPPLMWTYAKDHRIFEPSTSKISLFVQMEQIPRDDSTIRIDPSRRDENGLPQVVLDWRIDGGEIEALRDFAFRTERALREAGLARLEIDHELLRGDSTFLERLRDTNHQSGGAIMASSSSNGVVDSDLRVFGTDNLYVAGSSTFPAIGAANTTFTALALSARLVDRLTSPDGA